MERIKVKLTTVCLGLHAYSDVLSWAQSLIGSGEYLRAYYEYQQMDRREDPANAYYAKAYYNKALACEAMGLLNEAMPAILNAAEFDAEDVVISSQLAVLKKAHMEMKESKMATKRAKRAAKEAKLDATAGDAGINVDSPQLAVLRNVGKEHSRRRKTAKRAEKIERAAEDARIQATADDDGDIVDSSHFSGLNKARTEMIETEGATKESQWAANNVNIDPSPEVDPCDVYSTCLSAMQRVEYTPQPGLTFVRWD